MGPGDVGHMDVVPHARAVRRGVVGAEQARALAAVQGTEHERKEVVGARVPESRGPALVREQTLPDQLALPIGGLRGGRRRLRDALHVWGAVHGR